jgi:hypothetical protein
MGAADWEMPFKRKEEHGRKLGKRSFGKTD